MFYLADKLTKKLGDECDKLQAGWESEMGSADTKESPFCLRQEDPHISLLSLFIQ